MHLLELLGCGVLLAWIALPILVTVARRQSGRAPASAHRALLVAFFLAVACFALPAVREWLPRFMGTTSPVRLRVHVLATTVTDGVRGGGMARGLAIPPFALVGLAWAAACALSYLRLAVGWWRLRRQVARGEPAPTGLRYLLELIARASNVKSPALLLSADAVTPYAAGAFTPVIVLPAALVADLEPERMDLVLRHELAHIRRRDPVVHGFVCLFASLFPFHPTRPRLLRELTLTREAAVDAEVARHDPHAYATLLVEIASRVRFGEELAHVSMDDTALARRIAMLTDRKRRPEASLSALFVAGAAITTFCLFAPRIFADEPQNRFFGGPPDGPDPRAEHEGEIRACYDLARQETPDLVVDTLARFTLDENWRVASASVPTPASPTFQTCIEQKALSWTFPPPPNMPPPPKDVPKDAKRMVAFPIQLRP